MVRQIAAIGAAALGARLACAQWSTVAKWTFDSPIPDNNPATGTLSASTGSGTFSAIGNVSWSFVARPDSGDNNTSAVRLTDFPAQGTASGTAGFAVTINADPQSPARWLTLLWEHAASADACFPGVTVQGTTDGVLWRSMGTPFFSRPGGAYWWNASLQWMWSFPVAAGAGPVTIRAVARFGPSGLYETRQSTTPYSPSSTWLIDNVTVRATSSPPVALSPTVRVLAGEQPIIVNADALGTDDDAQIGDAVRVTAISGAEGGIFSIAPAGAGIIFTPPAAGSIAASSIDFPCVYTVTDLTGRTSSGTLTAKVYNDTVCSFTVSPTRIEVGCPAASISSYSVTAGMPPGTGGQVAYQWRRVSDGIFAGDQPVLHPLYPGVYACTAVRTGGAVRCGSDGSTPETSNTVEIVYNSRSADLGAQGGYPSSDGQYDNNDFIAFITFFFDGDPRADFGTQGGIQGSDGLFDNNDFIVFIDAFFDHC